MGSRVYDIKKKFEGLCEASNQQHKTESTLAKTNQVKISGLPIKKYSANGNNSSSYSTRARPIIKRSHAFRSDKSICTSRGASHTLNSGGQLYNPNLENAKVAAIKPSDKHCLLDKDAHVIFLSKMLSPQDECESSNSSNNSDANTDALLPHKTDSNDSAIKNNGNLVNDECADVSYCDVKPKARSPLTIPGSLELLNKTNEIQGSKKHISKSAMEHSIVKDSNKYNQKKDFKSVYNHLKTPIRKEIEGDWEDGNLSNTLKKVLKSPLPSGPPPKKPPRTFAHISEWANDGLSLSNGQKSEIFSSDDLNLPLEKSYVCKPIMRPARSKTESQIMLKKLEIALQQHQQQGKILEPKTIRKQALKDSDSSSKYEESTSNLSSNHLVIFRKTSLPDTPSNDKQASGSGCFGVLSCSNSMDLMKSSHIYDIPFESKSQFYVKEFNDVDQSMTSTNLIAKENNIPETNTFCYGKIKQSEVLEPIYAKPQIKSQLKSLKYEGKQEASSVSQIIKNINSNGKYKDPLDKRSEFEKHSAPSVLHYMSSPILEKVPFLQSAGPSSPQKSVTAQRKLFENLGTKSFPGRSSSFDFEILPKSGPGRSFSVDFAQAGDKDFQIDNEKIQMMVNEVYSKCLAMPQDSDSESVASTPDEGSSKPVHGKQTTSSDEAQKERQQRTAERKTYLKRVCSRTKSFHRPSEGFPHLFEYLLLIGLDLNPARCKVPYIKAKYPEDVEVPRGFEQLCFPDASDWPPQACLDETGTGSCYCVVITHVSGTRKYGYCRRVQPEGAPICLPLAYCIVSPYKANNYFSQVLAELESRHGQPDQTLSSFIQELHRNPFPLPGKGLQVTNPSTGEKMEILLRKLDPRQEETDIARLLHLVRFSVFLQLFATMLLERKIILLSFSISKLSTCVEGLCAALYPFHWQHTLVPIVPSSMLDLCQAPTPYVIGLLKPHHAHSQLPVNITSIDQVLVVDIDEGRVLQSCGDESTVLPPRLCRGLRDALHFAAPDKNTSISPAHNLIASEALIALFVQLVGHYRDHIITSSATGKREFQRDGFVKSVSSNTVQSFLDWFSETTMFTAFVETRLDRSVEPWGLFEQRCVEHLAQHQAKSYRSNINKTVKSFGDRFKEWTNSS